MSIDKFTKTVSNIYSIYERKVLENCIGIIYGM